MFNFLWKQPEILHGITSTFPFSTPKQIPTNQQRQVLLCCLFWFPFVFVDALTCHCHFVVQDLSKHFGTISTLSNVSALPSTLGAQRASEALQQLQRAVATAERGKQKGALEVAWRDVLGVDLLDHEPTNKKKKIQGADLIC